ncbi:hypothetical protein AB1Y20_021702 [Prymnesium parvum]|uniref:Uncharacterized protein n=1 Tax=Prymnesium parvum TaxID=97485 RepID=A0AB34JLZ4_PRYPA
MRTARLCAALPLGALHAASERRRAACDLRHYNSSQARDARWYREQAEHVALGLSLVDEARAGWWHEVTRRYRQGEAVDLADAGGVTVLHLAAKAGRRRIVEELLSRGAAYTADGHGRTPLLAAAASGQTSVATTLLEAKVADVNEADATGATALLLAAQAGHAQMARALLARPELDPNKADSYGVAPLHKATSFGHVAVVEALLEDARVQVDLDVGTPSVPDSYHALSGHETALHLAAGHTYHFNHTKHTRIAKSLLSAGADPNKRCGNGLSAAHRAARANNVGVLHELIACGRVDWDAKDSEGHTARDIATQQGHSEAATLLHAAARRTSLLRRTTSSHNAPRPGRESA